MYVCMFGPRASINYLFYYLTVYLIVFILVWYHGHNYILFHLLLDLSVTATTPSIVYKETTSNLLTSVKNLFVPVYLQWLQNHKSSGIFANGGFKQ